MKKLILIPLAIFAILMFYGCPQEQEDPTTEDPISDYLSTNTVTATHTKGSSPCPQTVGTIEVDNFEGSADSASITSTIDGIEMTFDNNETFAIYSTDLEESYTLTIKFTCGVAETINKSFEIKFYREGALVATETVEVKVTVVE